MKAFSIDLETTGLNPAVHGVTEFAAVYFDTHKPDAPKAFYRWINPEGYIWSNYCLKLHAAWIARILARLDAKQTEETTMEPKICPSLRECGAEFMLWLETLGIKAERGRQVRILPTGKNFGSFDKQFLKHGFTDYDVFRHRTVDWVPTYTVATDEVPPELALCKSRAIARGCLNLKEGVAHNALDDARDVMTLIHFANGLT